MASMVELALILKGSYKALKDFIITIPNDQAILRTITNRKLSYQVPQVMYPKLSGVELVNSPRKLKESSGALGNSPHTYYDFWGYVWNLGQFSLGGLGVHGLRYLKQVYDQGSSLASAFSNWDQPKDCLSLFAKGVFKRI